MRVFAAALGRHISDRTFENLEQRLLHAFAAHVTSDRRILVFLRDLVDLVDVNDPLLCLLNIPISRLQQLQDDIFHVLPDVSGFGQRGGVNDREWYVEHAGKRLCQQGLSSARGTDQENVGLAEFDLARLLVQEDALVMVIDRNRQFLLGALLPDHVAIEKLLDFGRAGKTPSRGRGLFPLFVFENRLADADALIADVRPRVVRRRTDQLFHLLLGLMAEGTAQRLVWAIFFHV